MPCGGLKGDLQTASQRQNPEAMAIAVSSVEFTGSLATGCSLHKAS